MTLLIIVCAQDLSLARLLLQRITQLGGWAGLSRLCLYLDHDTTLEEAELFLRPSIPLADSQVRILRDAQAGRWTLDAAGMALDAYLGALQQGQDVLRLDPDLYIHSARFFELLRPALPGFAGRLLPFFVPSPMQGGPLLYIQGGATRIGKQAAAFLRSLSRPAVDLHRRHPESFLHLSPEDIRPLHRRYFGKAEDLMLTGVECQLNDIPRHDLPGLQLSPHDVCPGYLDPATSAATLWQDFIASGALAFHYEGSGSGIHGRRIKQLKWAYEQGPS